MQAPGLQLHISVLPMKPKPSCQSASLLVQLSLRECEIMPSELDAEMNVCAESQAHP